MCLGPGLKQEKQQGPVHIQCITVMVAGILGGGVNLC